MAARLFHAGSAAVRIAAAEDWLARRSAAEQLLILAASHGAASELMRRVALERGALFGWRALTLGRLAGELAAPRLVSEGRVIIGGAGLQALVARVVFSLGARALGRYAPVGERPGFSLALAHTISELRLNGLDAPSVAAVDGDLSRLLACYEHELEAARLADRATVYAAARATMEQGGGPEHGLPLLLLDLPVENLAARELVRALAARSMDVFATLPEGDELSLGHVERALNCRSESFDREEPHDTLSRLQRFLFQEESPFPADLDEGLSLFSAPGESRECIEVARRVIREAERGVPFDRMAILVHGLGEYRVHLEEALRRADVPAHFAGDAANPDPSGRALLVLLACAAEGLAARRFAEFLSLGEMPRAEASGAPPAALPLAESWVPPDEELVARSLRGAALSPALLAREQDAAEADEDSAGEGRAALQAPRHWEQLINEAAVIGGYDRWVRRLEGLAGELRRRLDERSGDDELAHEACRRRLAELERLRAYALPLLELLRDLPARATWGTWIARLAELATRALRQPQRVLQVMAELQPMAPIGPIDLAEVRLVLASRLGEAVIAPAPNRFGAVLVAAPEAVRGMAFTVVFVVGLAEKLFPRKIVEDPLLPDAVRQRLPGELALKAQRVQRERLALRLAVGAARERLYLSYPRLDLQHARPRVPSFYCLEVLRAAEGRLPSFTELARLAELTGAARLSWPAPQLPRHAIDEAEHDLALLERMRDQELPEAASTLAHLLTTSPYLGRAARFRAQRWSRTWTVADGLVRPSPAAREALARHAFSARSYSPTVLECYAACPYRFLLAGIYRLTAWDEPEFADEMEPRQRGSLMHEVQALLWRGLEQAQLLPLTPATLEQAQALLEQVVTDASTRYRDDLAPAIERVWEDGVASIRADLNGWLRIIAASAGDDWQPWRWELVFDPVRLANGIQLRGRIDLVERNAAGELRITDHKTGKPAVARGAIVAGGRMLQPLLYALAAEQLFDQPLIGGRLSYCTMAGGYEERFVPLDEEARRASQHFGTALRLAFERGFFPAAPAAGACERCEYQVVCGPYEELRVQNKGRRALQELLTLRGMR